MTEDNDPAVFMSRLDSIESRMVNGTDRCARRLFPRHYPRELAIMHETDLCFDNMMRPEGILYAPNNRLALAISGGNLVYEDTDAMVEWNSASGMVSVLYPAEEILKNLGLWGLKNS